MQLEGWRHERLPNLAAAIVVIASIQAMHSKNALLARNSVLVEE